MTELVQRIASRVGRHLERRGLLVRDAENAWLDWDGEEVSPLDDLAGHAIAYRIAVGPNRGQKAFMLQTVPAIESEPGTTRAVASASGLIAHIPVRNPSGGLAAVQIGNPADLSPCMPG
jgi:hypothetical protein